MSELLLPPEHRYAKIIKERLNEDGSELSILNLGPTHYTVFSKYLVDGWNEF
jgi:NADH-quinone oxidoreductase subunit D